MRYVVFSALSVAMLLSADCALASPHVRRGPTALRLHVHSTKAAARTGTAHAAMTHAGMAPERATEIQLALVKAGYLSGTPSGAWDATSQAAMEKLQADNGWQTRIVPDSRALIKLGLGASNTAGSSAMTAPAKSQVPEEVEANSTTAHLVTQ